MLATDVALLVPHRPPMLLLGEIAHVGDDTITCRATVEDDNVFLEDGLADIAVCVELVAQAVAAFAGARAAQEGAPIARAAAASAGFVVGIREARFAEGALRPGDVLTVTATRLRGDARLASFRGHVARHGITIATVDVDVYRGRDEPLRGGP